MTATPRLTALLWIAVVTLPRVPGRGPNEDCERGSMTLVRRPAAVLVLLLGCSTPSPQRDGYVSTNDGVSLYCRVVRNGRPALVIPVGLYLEDLLAPLVTPSAGLCCARSACRDGIGRRQPGIEPDDNHGCVCQSVVRTSADEAWPLGGETRALLLAPLQHASSLDLRSSPR